MPPPRGSGPGLPGFGESALGSAGKGSPSPAADRHGRDREAVQPVPHRLLFKRVREILFIFV